MNCHSDFKSAMISSVWGGRESSTVRKYCLSIRNLLRFAGSNDLDISLPLASARAAEYLTYLKMSNKTTEAIDTALAAMKWAHLFILGINKWNNPMNNNFLAKIASDACRHLKGSKNGEENDDHFGYR